MINVNLIKSTKLGKIEKLTLLALLEPKEHYMGDMGFKHPEGNDVEGIAGLVFGEKVLNCEKPGGHYCTGRSVCYSAKSSLSRTLHMLWLKGFVKYCKPIYRYAWHPADPESDSVGFYGKTSKTLRCAELRGDGHLWTTDELFPLKTELPHRTHVWWKLTERGREKALELKESRSRAAPKETNPHAR